RGRQDRRVLVLPRDRDAVPAVRAAGPARPVAVRSRSRKRRRFLLAFVLVDVIATIVGRRRGYGFGTATIVRCRHGHLFTTISIPGVSLKSVRLGWWRIQRCPVGRHWTVVVPVRAADLPDDERRLATETRDVRIP